MKLPSSLGLAGLGCSLYTMGASATVTSNCVGSDSDVCFQWGVPESVASSGSGNVFFQLQAPNSYSWVGLGIGSQMRGADIFLIYTDGSGNVTLSTRSGTGHVMPEHVDMNGVELLEGSGVEDGQMTANIRCSSCDSLDLSSSNSWIAAWHSGDALDSSDVSESINIHTGKTVFAVDFAQASITSDSNPFVGDASDENGANDPGSDNGGVSSGGGGGPNLALIHGIIMLVAFVFMYPLGAILMPVVGRWYIHAGWQTIAFFLMWAGFGIGYVVAKDDGYWWTNTHTKMGTIVVALMGLQPILGGLHHMHYRKHQQRGIVSHVHIWYGRALMLIGIVNGGLGLKLAGSPKAFTVAYSVLAGIFGAAYVGAAIFGAFKRTPSLQHVKSPNSMAEAQS